MTTTIENHNDKWELSPSYSDIAGEPLYSSDTLIDAYLQGKKDQRDDYAKILTEKLEANLNNAKHICEEMVKTVLEKKVKFEYVLLKVKDLTEFETVFVVAEDDFISDSFKGIYELFIKKKREVNGDTFHFSFNIMPYSANISKEKLNSDGFILRYDRQ